MPMLNCLIVALPVLVLSPLAASALTSQQAYAQCRARYANYPEMPGTGNPVKEGIIEGCAQELMRRGGSSPPPQRTKTKSKPAER